MARLVAPASKAFRLPAKFPVSRSMPSQPVNPTLPKPASKPSMLPRPVLRQAVTLRSNPQIVRKTMKRSLASLGLSRSTCILSTSRADYEATVEVSASQIPRPVTAALKAANFRRRSQIIMRIPKSSICPVIADSTPSHSLSLSRPLLSKQAHGK